MQHVHEFTLLVVLGVDRLRINARRMSAAPVLFESAMCAASEHARPACRAVPVDEVLVLVEGWAQPRVIFFYGAITCSVL